MPKRNATSELNHDNWNDDDAPEEAGIFQKAAPDIIEKRVIKNARRRVVGSSESSTSVFAGFQGFNKIPENPALFSFLKKSNATMDSTVQDKVGEKSKVEVSSHIPMFKPSVPVSEQDPCQPSPPFTVSYLGAIKKLNECFLKHIQTCFDENKFIILSPCFHDYEQHLKSILPLNESDNKGEGENKKSEEKVEKPLSHKQGPDTLSLNAVSAKNTSFSGSANTEANSESGFKIFGSGKNATSPTSNAVSPGTNSPFGVPTLHVSKKQFSWLGGWGSTPGSPSVVSTNESAKETSKVDSTPTAGATANEEAAEESEAPPKTEFKQVVEEGVVYSRRCKVFVKKDTNYHDHGVGMLYLKPVESGKKTQLIVRADTSLGNLIVNTLLNADMSMQRMGNNNVMFVCIPTPDFKPPKPLPVLLRVKTSEDADELLQKLNEFKK